MRHNLLISLLVFACTTSVGAQGIIMPGSGANTNFQYDSKGRRKVMYDARGESGSLIGFYDKMERLDTLRLRIQYAVKYRDALEEPLSDDMEALYIGDRMSEFHENINQYAFEHIPDSLRRIHQSDMETDLMILGAMNKIKSKFKYSRCTIQKNYPRQGEQKCLYNLFQEHIEGNPDKLNPKLYYIESMPLLDWELLDGDTIVCGYACQRARTSFRGRTWMVWYAPELPYQDGPWKLSGLPGLIVKAYDTEGDFFFEAVEIIIPENEYIYHHPQYDDYVQGSFKRVQNLKKIRLENPDAMFSMMWGETMQKIMEQMGNRPKFPPKRTACLIERFE